MGTSHVVATLSFLVGLAACQPLQPLPPRSLDQPVGGSQISAQGVVLSVERPHPEDSQSYVRLVVAPGDQQPLRLVLAPGWYLERQGIRFAPHDSVHFEGRTVDHDGRASVEVQRIEQNGHSFTLRDEKNRPAWTASPSP